MLKLSHLGSLLALVLLTFAIAWAEHKQAGRVCQAIDIQVQDQSIRQFINPTALHQQLAPSVIGQPLRALRTRPIEIAIKADNFVHQSTVYKSWRGALKIDILPQKPIARILHTHQPDQYVDEEGTLLPWSDRYTARVLLIEASQLLGIKHSLKESSYGRALLDFLRYIEQDPFWRAQIAHLQIDSQGKIVCYTQISKQRIELGMPHGIAQKLAKLQLFYQKIVPHKGWNTYKRVNLEFANQIVCE